MQSHNINTLATDVLALKHQDIGSHSAGHVFIVLDQFHTEIKTTGKKYGISEKHNGNTRIR